MKHRTQYMGKIYTDILRHKNNTLRFGVAINKVNSVGKRCVNVIVKNRRLNINIKKYKKGDFIVLDCVESRSRSSEPILDLINIIKLDQYTEINKEHMAIGS